MQWQEILLSFNRCFPVFFLQNNNPKHQKEALSNLYYRAQMYPRIDNKGNLVLDQNGDEELVNIKVREMINHQHKAVLHDYIKLVTRCPERVLTYSWTDEEDKEKSRRISKSPCARGLCCSFTNLSQLPLAQHRVQVSFEELNFASGHPLKQCSKAVSRLNSNNASISVLSCWQRSHLRNIVLMNKHNERSGKGLLVQYDWIA